jgi:hypothetical protein
MNPDDERISRAALALRLVERVAVLTGAGISAESGLKTFRDSGGLWEGYRPEEVATPEAFAADPELVWRFYNARRAALWKASPNPGHVALVELAGMIGHWTLITQNVDRLHQRAGSRGVIELHGNLEDVRCPDCSLEANYLAVDLPPRPICPRCGALLRPAVVWFGEALPTGLRPFGAPRRVRTAQRRHRPAWRPDPPPLRPALTAGRARPLGVPFAEAGRSIPKRPGMHIIRGYGHDAAPAETRVRPDRADRQTRRRPQG